MRKVVKSTVKPKHFSLTKCQDYGLKLLRSNRNVFLSGEAGTGKSFLLRHYVETSMKNIKVLASTGAAAVLVDGITFNSFFRLGIMDDTDETIVRQVITNEFFERTLVQTGEIIIEEVSMLPGRALWLAEKMCRVAKDSTKPWGGIRVIAVGDFLQLPPVNTESDLKDWAFKNAVWKESNFFPSILKTKMRSSNTLLNNVLSDVRAGRRTKRVRKFLDKRLYEGEVTEFDGTMLLPRIKQVEKINNLRLSEIKKPEIVLGTKYNGDERYFESLKKNVPIPETVIVKEGALVMTRVNNRAAHYVNGTVGYVKGFDGTTLVITPQKGGKDIHVERHTFNYRQMDAKTNQMKVIASAICFPITLAWAVTIHKAQGATLDKALIDLSRLWEAGQAYVALSRLKSAKDLYILNWDRDSIISSDEANAFYERCLKRQAKLKKLKTL